MEGKPVITARNFLEYNHQVENIPESFVITSKSAAFHLLQFYKLQGARRITQGHIFTLNNEGIKIGIACPESCGAPVLAITVEELAALGAKRFILVGAAGALQPQLKAGSTILPTKAVREEGTSLHYAKPSKYAVASTTLSNAVERSLKDNAIAYSKGVVWTTDAFYRETSEKVRHYQKEGALCVDMESSALFSISRHCKTEATALLYITDSLATLEWQPYFYSESVKKSRVLLLKAAIDTLCIMENPTFKARQLKKRIKGSALVRLVGLAHKVRMALT